MGRCESRPVSVKGEIMSNRYYSIMRPVDIGTYPKPEGNEVLEIVNFDQRTKVEGVPRPAWGYVEYAEPLSAKDQIDYELFEQRAA